MVAYSFKRRFVDPIKVGLLGEQAYLGPVFPKRQTIRADRRRHARPGEELQLYCGMRTRQCFLIGRARCVEVQKIWIRFRNKARLDWIQFGTCKLDRPDQLDRFARGDGFYDWLALREFWRQEHGLTAFNGVLIRWEAQA